VGTRISWRRLSGVLCHGTFRTLRLRTNSAGKGESRRCARQNALNFVAATGFGACVEERAGERIYEVRLNLIAAPPAAPTFFSYSVKAPVTNNRTAAVVSLLFVVVAYFILAWAAPIRNMGEAADAEDPRQVRRLAYMLSPIRCTAGWYGDASMSQVQLVLLTFIVAGLLFHLWLTTGVLSDISKDLLILLGISAAGAGAAKFANTLKVDLKPETARFLIGKGWFNWK